MRVMKFAAALGAALVVSAPAHAAVTAIGMPNSAYVSATTVLNIAVDDYEALSSLSDSAVSVSFNEMMALTAGTSFGTWGSAPATEGAEPRVLFSGDLSTITFNFNTDLSVFGFEAEPDLLIGSQLFSVEYFLDGVSQGSVSADIFGNAGARLLAANGRFDKAVVTTSAPFGVAQLRYEVAGPISAVPEPAAWAMMIVGFGAAGTMIRRTRRSALVAA